MRAQQTLRRWVLADGQVTYRNYLRDFLEKQRQVRVVGEASDAEETRRLVDALVPDVVCLEVTLPGDGLAITRWIAATHPEISVIALCLFDDREFERAALDAGAVAFVSKGEAVERIPGLLRVRSIARVHGRAC